MRVFSAVVLMALGPFSLGSGEQTGGTRPNVSRSAAAWHNEEVRTALAGSSQSEPGDPHGCGWTPPATAYVVRVRRASELLQALERAKPRTTILLENGEYHLDRMAHVAVPGTVLRSQSGDPRSVVIRGGGMTGDSVGVALSIGAPDVTIADVTVGYVRYHAIQVRGERRASRATVHHVHLIDTGQQLLKGSAGAGGPYADDGLVTCSRFEYTTNAPSSYTDGVDILAAKGWVIRDNVFLRIRGPERDGWRAGPAILAWANSQDTLIERNVVIDSFRGIAIGLAPGITPYARDGERQIDHQRGVVRNNVICNLHAWADEAIEANASTDFRIEHNSVLTLGVVTPWTIGVRYPTTRGVIRNNLVSQQLLRRHGGSAEMLANVTSVALDWFTDAATCDLHLSPLAREAIDAGVDIPEVGLDYDRQPRTGKPDLGAFEFRGQGPEALSADRYARQRRAPQERPPSLGRGSKPSYGEPRRSLGGGGSGANGVPASDGVRGSGGRQSPGLVR